MHRIPHSLDTLNGFSNETKEAVLLVHGCPSSGAYFLIHPNKSYGLLLSDEGYDVWVVQVRGVSYATINKPSQINSKKYWNYSFHELGYYDLPRAIDFIIEVTGNQKIHYIGHSQGGTDFLAMLSTKPDYNEKIASAYLLTPGVFLPLTKSSEFQFRIFHIYNFLNINSFQYKNSWMTRFYIFLCQYKVFNPMCYDLMAFLIGPTSEGTDKVSHFFRWSKSKFQSIFLTSYPSGTV